MTFVPGASRFGVDMEQKESVTLFIADPLHNPTPQLASMLWWK